MIISRQTLACALLAFSCSLSVARDVFRETREKAKHFENAIDGKAITEWKWRVNCQHEAQ